MMLIETKRTLSKLLPRRVGIALRETAWKFAHPWCTLRSGVSVEIASMNQWIVFVDIFIHGEYDLAIDSALLASGDEFIALDLGANVGFFSLRLADRLLRSRGTNRPFSIYAVEGANAEYTELERRLKQPALAGRCKAIHGLVGKRSGPGAISRGREHTNQLVTDGSGDRVEYVDLNSILPETGAIDLLKCDIEGSEETFLENYRDILPRVRTAVFELHGDRCDTGNCERLLIEEGFANQQTTTVNGECRVVIFTR